MTATAPSTTASYADALRLMCARDPDYFSRIILGRRRWSAQVAMRKAIWDHRRVHVQSANSVGKTFDLGGIICEWLLMNPGGRVICTGPTYEQVRDGLWVEVRRAWDQAAARGIKLSEEPPGAGKWRIANGWDATIISVSNISAIQGRRGRKCLIVADEAQGIEDGTLWDAMESLMTAEGSRFVESGNPLKSSGRFFDHAASPDWHSITIDGLDHPNVVHGREVIPGAITAMWVEEKRTEWGEDDPRWWARVRGQFPESDDYSLITLRMAQECRKIEGDLPHDGAHMGMDIARFGGDANVAVVIKDRRLVHVESWRGEDLMQTCGRLRNVAETWKVPHRNIHLDICGMGAGVYDRLAEQGIRVDGVDFGSGPKDDWRGTIGRDVKVKNRRAELYWVLRQLMRDRQIEIPAEYRAVVSDICAPTYSHDSAGRVQIESKDSIKSRIGRSPDFGDALTLALSRTASAVGRIRYV